VYEGPTETAKVESAAEDTEVIALAAREERIVLTEDGDFGQLVYAHVQQTHGVVFMRYPITMRKRLDHDVVTLVKQRGGTLIGCFVVLQPGRIRISRVPGE
jgi:predicted nuclease of predicted toxin-antitoxin system